MAFEPVLAWDLYGIAGSEMDPSGFLLIQPDHYGEKAGGGPSAEAHYPFGLWGNPPDPETDADGNLGVRCNVLWAWEGGQGHAFPGSDPRVTPLLPNRVKGESGIYGARGNFFRCQVDGACTAYTTADGTTTGQVVYRRAAPSGFADVAPWGRHTFDPYGWRVVTASGARFVMGGIGGIPAPLSVLGSYAKLSASALRFEGSLITLGPAAGAGDAVARATGTNLTFAAVDSALVAIGVALAALQAAVGAVPAGTTPAPSGGGPAALGAAITAAIAAVGGAATAIGTAGGAVVAAQASIPSTSTTVV